MIVVLKKLNNKRLMVCILCMLHLLLQCHQFGIASWFMPKNVKLTDANVTSGTTNPRYL
jgi:hypothetical protein